MPETQDPTITFQIIEAECMYRSHTSGDQQEVGDTDDEGPRPLEEAHDFYIKWGLLNVQWEKDGQRASTSRLPRMVSTRYKWTASTSMGSVTRGNDCGDQHRVDRRGQRG